MGVCSFLSRCSLPLQLELLSPLSHHQRGARFPRPLCTALRYLVSILHPTIQRSVSKSTNSDVPMCALVPSKIIITLVVVRLRTSDLFIHYLFNFGPRAMTLPQTCKLLIIPPITKRTWRQSWGISLPSATHGRSTLSIPRRL